MNEPRSKGAAFVNRLKHPVMQGGDDRHLGDLPASFAEIG